MIFGVLGTGKSMCSTSFVVVAVVIVLEVVALK